ncbi:MAG TPA: class I SAM-dependent methyltransferase [Rugosimonospora sp.]|nr:class I SAM-dependent methyltransferase [Rugosimonospora sp.]
MIRTLPRVVPAAPGKPVRAEAHAAQQASRAIAEDPSRWSAQQARQTIQRYAELAPVWDTERGGYRPVPLADALARGGPLPAGTCAEVGCGTGLLTPLLASVWPRVVCLDLSPAMLDRSRAPWRVLADASRLPLPDGRAAAVVLADTPLFAGEVVRVLAPGGVVVWSNALGTDAPHHVPVATVLDALARASGVAWSALTAEAGWGLWAVLRHG